MLADWEITDLAQNIPVAPIIRRDRGLPSERLPALVESGTVARPMS